MFLPILLINGDTQPHSNFASLQTDVQAFLRTVDVQRIFVAIKMQILFIYVLLSLCFFRGQTGLSPLVSKEMNVSEVNSTALPSCTMLRRAIANIQEKAST